MKRKLLAWSAVLCVGSGAAAMAQDAADALHIQLNTVKPGEDQCLVHWRVANFSQTSLTTASYVAAFADRSGAISRVASFSFTDLPSDKVRVYAIPLRGLDCDDLGAVILDSVRACEAVDGASTLCDLDRVQAEVLQVTDIDLIINARDLLEQ